MKTTHPVIVGIDTHKTTHVAVAIDTQGGKAATADKNAKLRMTAEIWQGYGNIGK